MEVKEEYSDYCVMCKMTVILRDAHYCALCGCPLTVKPDDTGCQWCGNKVSENDNYCIMKLNY